MESSATLCSAGEHLPPSFRRLEFAEPTSASGYANIGSVVRGRERLQVVVIRAQCTLADAKALAGLQYSRLTKFRRSSMKLGDAEQSTYFRG
ncbi:unnamed protein product [Hermetia illucens]|uniref:Uncharacterized protein n=1 Tax=Hermetia illucens TaxID=343691 RepID=A0A7R8V6M6_HERIL|nr:unnamed protein product [Hermetia illucens]